MGAMALSVTGLGSCTDDYDKYDNSYMLDNDETMTLEASSSSIELDAEALDAPALTFTWTPARQMPDEYVISYVTMLDLKVNQFSASTVIRNVENEGVFERTYTTEELQNLITEKWGRSISEVTTISFKVIAKWDGGTQYVMPEYRTVDVDVQPYKPLTFDADKVFLDGEAVKSIRPSSNYTMTKTPENEFIYAGEFLIGEGTMTIPIEYDGITRYICPASGESVNVPDNEPVDGKPAGSEEYPAAVRDIPDEGEPDLPAWNLPAEGYWRVIIDMENKTVRFFSPKNRLEPLTVEFNYASTSSWVLGKELTGGTYYVNTMTGWDGWKGKPYDFVASQIDPQLLICSGVSISPDAKFCIKTGQTKDDFDIITEGTDGNNPTTDGTTNFVSRIYGFHPENNVDTPLVMNQWMPMVQTVSNTKWTFEGSITISKITIDLRNNQIRFD